MKGKTFTANKWQKVSRLAALKRKNLLVVCKVSLKTIILHDNVIRKH